MMGVRSRSDICGQKTVFFRGWLNNCRLAFRFHSRFSPERRVVSKAELSRRGVARGASLAGILFIGFFIFSGMARAENKIVAIVGSDAVTTKDMADFTNFMRLQLSQEYADQELERRIEEIKPDLLDRLIEDKLIIQEAKALNIGVDKDRVKSRIRQIKDNYPSDREFYAALGVRGLVQADLEKRITEQMLTFSVIDKMVKAKIRVLPQEITDFYQNHREEFTVPAAREFELVISADKKQIDGVIADYWGGKSFVESAKQHGLAVNVDKSYRDGRFARKVEDEIFSLNPGVISEPMQINNIWYLFRVKSVLPSRQQKLEDVQQAINSLLFDEKMRQGLGDWLKKLKEKAYIKIIP